MAIFTYGSILQAAVVFRVEKANEVPIKDVYSLSIGIRVLLHNETDPDFLESLKIGTNILFNV